jgi:cleavage and polyadenylation specificity factor subunit 2
MFNLTSLLGAQSSSPASQSLVEFEGGIKVLIDVGWSEDFDASALKQLEKHVPTLSFILLTHATTAHLGAFAHCCKHLPLFARTPVYATEPVIALGRTLLQDIYASTPLAASILPLSALSDSVYSYSSASANDRGSPAILLQPPTHTEIAGYFNLIHPLKYSQPHEPLASPLSPPLNGLTVTAYSAGHTLGGTIWHIQSGLESVVYAVDWNQAREHVLSGAAWLGSAGASEVIEGLRRPTALVCSSRGSQRIALAGGRKKRDELLLDLIKDTIVKGGTVLIPSDSSARVLELAYLLEDAWSQAPSAQDESSLKRAKLYMASATSTSTVNNARRMLEWMDPSMVRELENASQSGPNTKTSDGKSNPQSQNAPFEFSHLNLIERKSQVNRALSREGPKVIVASDSSLEWGFSRTFLEGIAQDSKNLIILTERTSPISPALKGIGRLLWDIWVEKSGQIDASTISEDPPTAAFSADGAEVTSQELRTEQLTGSDLSIYQQYLARQRQLNNTLNTERVTSLETVADVADDNSSTTSESTEDEDEEQQGKALNTAAALAHGRHKLGLSDAELGIDILVRRKGHYDYDVRGKKGRERMFPFATTKRNQRNDDYGDTIRPEDYLRAEERDEVNADDVRDSATKKEAAVGQKRKWDEVGTESAPNGKRISNGTNKRRKAGDGQSDALGGSTLNGDLESDASDAEDGDEEPRVEGPVKVIFSKKTIRLDLRIAFVDFSGLHDKRSLQMLIPLIRPRKLILIGGEEQETDALAADCRQLLRLEGEDATDHSTDIFTPVVGFTVDASVDTNAWTVKLSKPLLKRLHWQNVRGLGVVALTGRLRAADPEEADEEHSSKKQKTVNGKGEDISGDEKPEANGLAGTPILDLVTVGVSTASRIVAQPIHVGDIRLADLRKSLQAANYAAEFRGEGTLVINNMVAVRKSATGRIELEGLVSLGAMGRPDSTFSDTKRKVYDMLAVVSGA